MFALVYWPDGRTISVVSKTDIKCKNPVEGSEYPIKWGNRSFVGRILKFGDKADLEMITVDPEGHIISGLAVTTEVAASRLLLNEDKRNQQMLVTEATSSINKRVFNMAHVQQTKASGSHESETKDPDDPDCEESVENAARAEIAAPAVQRLESNQTLMRIFEPVFSLVTESNLKFVSTLAQALADGVEYLKSRPNAELGEASGRDNDVFTAFEPRRDVKYPCDDKHGKGMRELVPGSQIFINKYRKSVIVTRAGTNSRMLVRELFKELVGEDILRTCSAKGLRDKLAVRKDVYDAVEAFVREWTAQIKEKKTAETVEELPPKTFAHVFNTYVNRLRASTKGKEQTSKPPKIPKDKTSGKKRSPPKTDGQGSGVKTRSSARKEAAAMEAGNSGLTMDEGKLRSATRTLDFTEDPSPSCSSAPQVYQPQYHQGSSAYSSHYEPPYHQVSYEQTPYHQPPHQPPYHYDHLQSQYHSTNPLPDPHFLSL